MAQMASELLRAGSVRQVFQGHRPKPLWLQVLTAKSPERAADGSAPGHVKASLSDGECSCLGVFQGPLMEAFVSGALKPMCVVPFEAYSVMTRNGKSFIVCRSVDLERVVHDTTKHGSPVFLDSVPEGDAAQAPAAPSAAAPKPNPFASSVGTSSGPAGGAAPVAEENGAAIHPISTLSPYNNQWTIRARVTAKGDVRHFTNARGEGKVFGFTLMDASGEIRATAFNDAVDRFFPLVTEGQVYTLAGGSLRPAKRQFGGVRNDYEIQLGNESRLELVRGADAGVPALRFSFVPIASLSSVDKDATVDVLGIVRDVGELGSVTTRATQKTLAKRDLTIADASGASVRLTLWGAQAEAFSLSSPSAILAVRGARVSDYGGRTLSAPGGAHVVLNPDVPEAHALRGWFDAEGAGAVVRPLSSGAGGLDASAAKDRDPRRTVQGALDAAAAAGERPEYMSLLATVTYLKAGDAARLWYTACPRDGCGRKVAADGPGMFRCERCNVSLPSVDHRYVLSLQVADDSGQMWLSAFNDAGELLMGGTRAADLAALQESDPDAFRAALAAPLHRAFVFRVRSKRETYMGEEKTRFQVMAASPVDHVREAEAIASSLGL